MKTILFAIVMLMSFSAFSQENQTVLHFYRPKTLYGCGWAYKVKINDKIIKVKNGSVATVNVPNGNINIEILDIGRQKITISEASGEYYFRGSIAPRIFPIPGKPTLVVTEADFAQNEITMLK